MDFIADDFPAIGAALAKLEGRVELTPDPLDRIIERAIAAQGISECREAAKAAHQYANALRQPGSVVSIKGIDSVVDHIYTPPHGWVNATPEWLNGNHPIVRTWAPSEIPWAVTDVTLWKKNAQSS